MKPENLKFLQDNEHHWITLRDAFYLRSLNAMEREGMVRVLREEWFPGYNCDLWCPPCVADMVKLLYRKYEEWKEQQAKLVVETVPEPIVVKANFPKHDKKKK